MTDEGKSPLLRTLPSDLLGAVLKLLDEADLPCARFACRAFRDHSSPAQKMKDFLRTRALAVFACERMAGFIIDEDVQGWSMLTIAASVGCVGVLAELVDNRQCGYIAEACAAAVGHVEVLRYAHEHGCPWESGTCDMAAEGENLEVLRDAHEHGCKWDSDLCKYAAEEGHLEVLRYAHEHGCEWDSDTCKYAAQGGHLEVLRYAHEHGCPWSEQTTARAARGGHLEVLRYALECGCPLAWDILETAVHYGHAEMSMSRRRALDGGKKGGSKNLAAAAACQARQAVGMGKYASRVLDEEVEADIVTVCNRETSKQRMAKMRADRRRTAAANVVAPAAAALPSGTRCAFLDLVAAQAGCDDEDSDGDKEKEGR
ncbi:hypothetical protein T492DRAFT_916680 [Pavlovales sp. CCMP2436]|nr:hypothetical protein T492DRAFT_916680 [Pavlovales sp. CCMP2436]